MFLHLSVYSQGVLASQHALGKGVSTSRGGLGVLHPGGSASWGSASRKGLHPVGSASRGVLPTEKVGQTPLRNTWDTTGYSQRVCSMHPTGMHSC